MRLTRTVLTSMAAVALAAIILRAATRRPVPAAQTGTFANGMRYAVWDGGDKTLLAIMGGPGSALPSPRELAMMAGSLRPYLDDGFTVWTATRRRGMPTGYSVADMAADYAEVIETELGGKVDVVVGEELGGLIALQLAADRPELLDRLAVVRTAWQITEWGKDADGRFGEALSAGRFSDAGAAVLEEIVPGPSWATLRRSLGPLIGRWLATRDYDLADVLVETRAEQAYDGRAALPRIDVPVLIVVGGKDRVFAPALAAETAELIPRSRLVEYPTANGLRTASSPQVPRDVLAFVHGPAPTASAREATFGSR
ncbi:alpha/beta hydrolase [Actinotalea sp. M2MS4P-6]|uniref:alpha/beta fold hydrolase n=1 Tax=Actinotalea sp. M2MS4P-6 TaxID=2983762 RepID=UPI0021E3F5C7|nr:alpha/beta hydrolase [Actinotalea sp. M2MS4P-6]MCV2393120.1 alpha/beta hydrolase [Actinotalea sp. M2MS4P-6]